MLHCGVRRDVPPRALLRNDTLALGCWMCCGRQPPAVSPTEVVSGGELPAQGQGTPHLMTRADIGIQRPAPSLHLGTTLKSHPNFRTSRRIRTPHADRAAAHPLPLPSPAPSLHVTPRALLSKCPAQ